MISYPNQKIINIYKQPCNEFNLYAVYNLEALSNASKNLTSRAFKLWIYLGSNQDGFQLALSNKDVSETMGISKCTYDKAVKELIEKGYLEQYNDCKNRYYFNEFPM